MATKKSSKKATKPAAKPVAKKVAKKIPAARIANEAAQKESFKRIAANRKTLANQKEKKNMVQERDLARKNPIFKRVIAERDALRAENLKLKGGK